MCDSPVCVPGIAASSNVRLVTTHDNGAPGVRLCCLHNIGVKLATPRSHSALGELFPPCTPMLRSCFNLLLAPPVQAKTYVSSGVVRLKRAVRAIRGYNAQTEREMSISEGDVINVSEQSESMLRGPSGWFPANHVVSIEDESGEGLFSSLAAIVFDPVHRVSRIVFKAKYLQNKSCRRQCSSTAEVMQVSTCFRNLFSFESVRNVVVRPPSTPA